MRDIEQADLRVGDKVRVYTNTEPGLVEGTVKGTNEHRWFSVAFAANSLAVFYPQYVNRIVLLDRPEPEIPVGTAGTATVRGDQRRAWRVGGGFMTILPNLGAADYHPDDDNPVTNFVPDELLTDESREQIRAEERERIASAYGRRWGPGAHPYSAYGIDVKAWLKAGAR